MDRRAFVIVLTGAAFVVAGSAFGQGAPAQPAPAQKKGPRWGQQADKEFRLGRGLGAQLMTEEEWKEHQTKMRTLNGEERERYRQEVHEKMVERAKEKGITMPAAPRGPAGGPKGRGPSS
jgi:hypothetical protein